MFRNSPLEMPQVMPGTRLRRIRASGVSISLEDGEIVLRYRGKTEKEVDQLWESEIRWHKPELVIDLIKERLGAR
jgi:hypothetical protein